MAYKVFLSHSTRDQGLVVALANVLSKFGVQPFVAEWYLTPGEKLERKILTQIEASDCVLVLLTRNGVRSDWVHQEVGHAMGLRKLLIPLVEKGTSAADLAALQSREYIEYDAREPKEALVKTATYVVRHKLKKEDREKALLVAGGITAFFLLLLPGGRR